MEGALVATYTDGEVTINGYGEGGKNDNWWTSHTDFDKEAFLHFISTNIKALDSEKRAEHLTELQEYIMQLQLQELKGNNEGLLEIAYNVEKTWKDMVLEGLAEDEVNAARILEEGKEKLEFEPTMDISEFADWFAKADNEGKRNMLKLLKKSLTTEGIPALEKERIEEMIETFSDSQ